MMFQMRRICFLSIPNGLKPIPAEHECLDHFVVVSQKQLNVIGRKFQIWHNYERPHSSVNSLPPGDQRMPELTERDSTDDMFCTTRLGGLLKNYSRRAA